MSIAAVAKKDFQDAIRSRLMVAVAVMFVAFTGGGIALANIGGGTISAGIVGMINTLRGGTVIFIPIIALGIAYRSIAGEQTSGSLKLLLSLPNSRLDVVLGKFLGRTAVVTVAIIIGFISMLLAAALTVEGNLQAEVIITFMLSALLLAIVFVSIAVSVSAFANSTFGAAIGSFSFFILFQFAWRGLIFLIRYLVNGRSLENFPDQPPDWVEVLTILNPQTGWSQADRWLVRRVADSEEIQGGSADAFYLEPWFGFVVLALWIVVPLVLGYVKFEVTDL